MICGCKHKPINLIGIIKSQITISELAEIKSLGLEKYAYSDPGHETVLNIDEYTHLKEPGRLKIFLCKKKVGYVIFIPDDTEKYSEKLNQKYNYEFDYTNSLTQGNLRINKALERIPGTALLEVEVNFSDIRLTKKRGQFCACK